MGSIVSYLLGSDSATDDENDAAGGNEDVTTIRSLLLQVPESSEEQTPQQWDAILQHIENHPEEAALFCHGQESSREFAYLIDLQLSCDMVRAHIVLPVLVPFSCMNTYFMRTFTNLLQSRHSLFFFLVTSLH